jgi:aminocarboxymuconate-semialdehyde decarboxylase
MAGVSIGSNVNGKNLDAPELGPFFAKAQELDVPLFIHPVAPQIGLDRLGSHELDNLIGNVTDTAVAAASLIFGGVLDEFPRLKPYLAHGGGSCPFIRGRWDRGWRARGAGVGIPNAPSEYLKRLYYDALTHSHETIEHLVRFAGAGHVMLGSDYPYDMGDPDPVKQIESAPGLTDAEKRQVLHETAIEVFGIDRA